MALTGIGFEFAFTVVILAAVGWGLDHLTGWTPVGLLTGLVLGTVVGMINMIRSALRGTKPKPKPKADKQP